MTNITEAIFELLTEHNVCGFWRAFTDKYTADNDGANEEFIKNLQKTDDIDSLIFELSCLYEFYRIHALELKNDLHYRRLVSIYEEKYAY